MTYDPYRIIQLESLRDYLFKTDAYFERKVKRWFSTTFHTPLEEVYNLSWDFVLRNYYEYMMEQNGYNLTFDMAKELLPELAQDEEKANQAFADSLVEEQKETLRKKAKRDKKIEKLKKKETYIDKNISDSEYMKKAQQYQQDRENSNNNKNKKQSLKKENVESKQDSVPNIPTIDMTFDDDI